MTKVNTETREPANGGETPLLSKPFYFGFILRGGYPPISKPFLEGWIATGNK